MGSQNKAGSLASLYTFLPPHPAEPPDTAALPIGAAEDSVLTPAEGQSKSKDPRSEIASLLHEQFARLARQFRTIELPNGITPERLSALAVIEKRGPISVTALAETELVRPATMSRMVTALVDEGLVKRSDDKNDGRGVLVSTTPKGKRAFQKAHSYRLQHFAEMLGALSSDQLEAMRSLTDSLERLNLLLDKTDASR